MTFRYSIVCFGLVVVILATSCARREAYRALETAIQYEEAGFIDRAMVSYDAALEASPDDAFVLRAVGNAYSRHRLFATAQELYIRAAEIEPAYIVVYEDLFDLARVQGMPDAALGWLERASSFVPDYAPLSEGLVDLYVEQDRLDDALALLERILDAHPDEAWAHFRLGHLRIQLRDYGGAIESFERTLEVEPSRVEGWTSLGTAYYESGDTDAAIVAYEQALKIDPKDDHSLNNLAWTYAVRGERIDEAIRLSKRSLRIRPDTPQYLDTLADLYYQSGQRAQAVGLIRYALSLNPESSELIEHLQRQLARFERGPYSRV